jgi:hypothetical protein
MQILVSYAANVILEQGTKQTKNILVIDSVVTDLLYRNMRANNQAEVNAKLRTQLYYELVGMPFNEDVAEIIIRLEDIEMAIKSKDKPKEDIPSLLKARVLESSLSMLVEQIQKKPALNLSEKITNAIIEAIRLDILRSPEFQKLAAFEDMIALTESSGFSLSWVKTAALLSLHEVMLKNWLKKSWCERERFDQKGLCATCGHIKTFSSREERKL